MKREAKITQLWNQYCRKEQLFGVFELKQVQGDKFYFFAFEPHQIDSLMAVEEGGLVWKLSDLDFRKKPADVISLPPSPAFVVVKYPDAFVMIRINEFVNFMNNTQNSFMTYKEARNIATKIVVQ